MRMLLALACIAMFGCNEPDPYFIQAKKSQRIETPTTTWKVEGQGMFKGGSEDRVREIFIITSPDGRKYLAITGCGVSEIHSVTDGDGNTKTVEE